MASTKWPLRSDFRHIGRRTQRLDGPAKVTGRAKYAYDINRPHMLIGKILSCPHAHARVVRIDTSAAEAMPGVRAVLIMTEPGNEVQWEGAEIVSVAAETEEQAMEAVRTIQVEYEVLDHLVDVEDFDSVPDERKMEPRERAEGDVDAAMSAAAHAVENQYGLAIVTHCCLEPHGQVAEWTADDAISYWPSTQNVSGYSGQVASSFNIPAANVSVSCQYIGGGFGSKFGVDRWGIEAGRLAKETGRPVKIMLERNQELMMAGMRPSAFARVRIGCDSEGILTAFDSMAWGTSGVQASPNPPMPYIFTSIPNTRSSLVGVRANTGPARAWRAPNHPQAALLTMSAVEDLASEMGVDPLGFFMRNLHLTPLEDVYREEMEIAAEMINYRGKSHPRGDSGPGPVKKGLGTSIHTWRGSGHQSRCQCDVHSDGSVELRIGTQDLGTGTRTIMAIVAGETLGLPIDNIGVRIGENSYPQSGASGGSTTVGGVSSSTRRAATAALNELFAIVAPILETSADELEAVDGRIRSRTDTSRSLSWAEATSKIGPTPISVTATRDEPGDEDRLYDGGVGGVQMAEVSVDVETGIIRVENMVAVQDCGLVMDLMTAESQVYGAMIMGICGALYEEKIADPQTGRLLNPNMETYKLAGIGDIGRLQVHMMTGPGYDERGPVGLGEPPANSPIAAISNAVANAIGVRVQFAPFTPDRVLGALDRGGRA